jgi:hypothetical protein
MVFSVLDEMTVLILNITVMNEMLHFVYKFYTLHLIVEELGGFKYLIWKLALHITRTVQEDWAEVSLVATSTYSRS